MDSAKFIRNKTVMSAWLVTPLLLAGILERSAHSYVERQRTTYLRNQTLKRIIPKMSEAEEDFERFIAPYKADKTTTTSVQDMMIQTINSAAKSAPLTVSSIKLQQDIIEKSPKTTRITIQITGEGTPREITAFLSNVKKTDPQIYETRISIIHNSWEISRCQLESELSRIYIQPE